MFGHQFGQDLIFGLDLLLKVVDSFLLGGMVRPGLAGGDHLHFSMQVGGVEVIRLSGGKEGEPPPELFQIPEGYRVEEAED